MKVSFVGAVVTGLVVVIPTALVLVGLATIQPEFHIGAAAGVGPLTWAPPAGWESYQRVSVDQAPGLMRTWTDGVCTALPNNLIIELPVGQPYYGAINLEGGGNIVIIGGEIQIPWQGDGASISSRRAIKVQDCPGQTPRYVHIEGVEIGIDDINANCSSGTGVRTNFDPGCSDLSEGIQIAAPGSVIQLQNIRINHIHARDQASQSDNHPDLIQTWGSYGELRVDRFTGHTDYQGIFLKVDTGHIPGGAHLKNVNVIGDPTGTQLFWSHYTPGASGVTLEGLWVQPAPGKSLNYSVFPNLFASPPDLPVILGTDGAGQEYAVWPAGRSPLITGAVYKGIPGGDYVPGYIPGLGYVSPGYVIAGAPPPAPPPPPPAPVPEPVPAPSPVPVPPPAASNPPAPPPAVVEEEQEEDAIPSFFGGAGGLQQLITNVLAQNPQALSEFIEDSGQINHGHQPGQTPIADSGSGGQPNVLGVEAEVGQPENYLPNFLLFLLILVLLNVAAVMLREYQTHKRDHMRQ